MAIRKAHYTVADLFINRWSARAMSGASLSHEELMSLCEAARWAPSSYNNQPWRFVYVQRETAQWQSFFDLLVDFNKQWCTNAAVLVLVISQDTFSYNGKPSRTHSFDTGAATMSFALQGHLNGLVVHAMEGFDYERARVVAGVPAGYTVECMVAVGKPGATESLSPELQSKEEQSDRKPVSEFVFEGHF